MGNGKNSVNSCLTNVFCRLLKISLLSLINQGLKGITCFKWKLNLNYANSPFNIWKLGSCFKFTLGRKESDSISFTYFKMKNDDISVFFSTLSSCFYKGHRSESIIYFQDYLNGDSELKTLEWDILNSDRLINLEINNKRRTSII